MQSSRRLNPSVPVRNSRNTLLLSQSTSPSPTQLPRSSSTASTSSTPGVGSGANTNTVVRGISATTQITSSRARLLRASTYESQTDGPPRLYLLGTRVECRVAGWSRYYSGRVSAVNTDGTLMVSFDDGDLRDCVQLANTCFETRVSTSAAPARIKLYSGSQIEYFQDARWFPGRVSDLLPNDRFGVTLCDGRVIRDVTRDRLRCYIPSAGNLAANEEVDVLISETRTWVKATVDETLSKVQYKDEVMNVVQEQQIADIEMRYPIANVPRPPEDEDTLDAAPMILSMQERLSQSIEVGAHVLITDKNGGALPKTGKADSAQVSIINFPLPADGIIEALTLRLFEAPAEDSQILDVVLFDREQIPSTTRTHRLSSTESHDEGSNSPQIGAPSAEPQVARFFIAPDLPYRPSRSYVTVDPHSRAVQTLKLAVPLRGSAGQYLGVMNRRGRLNIAYTPDKKKPGESWSEKSVEVFYMMPRMVPRPFAGGPHATRDWHGRAGWFALMIVSDPVDAVDPGWQRRCEIDALARRDGELEVRRICWLISSLVKEGRVDANTILFDSPGLVRALRCLCEVDDSVVELITKLCTAAASSNSGRKLETSRLQAFLRLQKALHFKAYEMQVVQRGRLTTNVTSFQSILRCLLVMKRLLNLVSSPQVSSPSSNVRAIKVTLKPRPVDAPAPIMYHVLKDGRLVVSRSDFPELKNGSDELIVGKLRVMGGLFGNDLQCIELFASVNGPILDQELYFPYRSATAALRWAIWTNPIVLNFQSTQLDKLENGAADQDHRRNAAKDKERDWLDDLERATLLLHSFAKQEVPSTSFVREQLMLWKQLKHRLRVESPHPIGAFSEKDTQRVWKVVIPGASRLKLEWHPQTRLQESDGSAIQLSSHNFSICGRNGMPPPIERVEGDSLDIRVVRARVEDPGVIWRACKQLERDSFPPARGIVNSSGTPAYVTVDRAGEAKYLCVKCFRNPSSCCEGLGSPENSEGRLVSPLASRGTWACSICANSQHPCSACSNFPFSAAMNTIRVRDPSTFSSTARFEAFLKKVLVPGMPVQVKVSVKGVIATILRRFDKLIGDKAMTSALPSAPPPPVAVDVPQDSVETPLAQIRLCEERNSQITSAFNPVLSPDFAPPQGLSPVGQSINDGADVSRPRRLSFPPSDYDGESSFAAPAVIHPSVSTLTASSTPQVAGAPSNTPPHLRATAAVFVPQVSPQQGSNRATPTQEEVNEYSQLVDSHHQLIASQSGANLANARPPGLGNAPRTISPAPVMPLRLNMSRITHLQNGNNASSSPRQTLSPSAPSAGPSPAPSPSTLALNATPVDWAANQPTRPGTFATTDLGPDIVISNNGLTVTRTRSLGWGTQRMSRYLDASCGVTTIAFRIDRNTSNHLFFGVVAPTFEDLSQRMIEPGAWSIRRDGSTHADGRERTSASPDARLITGETLTVIVDMISDPRCVSFSQNGTLLGKLAGLPARVVPAVSFGGSNQIVTITSFSMSSANPSSLVRGGTTASGKTQSEWGLSVDIIPEYDSIDEEEELAYIAACSSFTMKQDRAIVSYVDEVAVEKKLTLVDVLNTNWEVFHRKSSKTLLDTLLQEEMSMEAVGQRFEWLRALNASVARALPLLDLNFDEKDDGDGAPSVVNDLSECSHLLFEVVKKPMWEDALECTRTEEGQFEVVLDYGRALAHRQFVDLHGRFSVFGQAFRAINSMPPSRLRGRGQLYRATLRGMRAHDDGGPYRQSFQTYCAELLSTPGVGLFLPCANRVNEIHVNRDRWLPNPGARSALQISMFEFIGKLMGIALRNHEFLDLRLPSLVWKWLVNRKPVFEDLRAVDLLFANTVQEMLESESKDDTDVWGDDGGGHTSMNFTIFTLDGRVCELVPNGEQRLVAFAQDRLDWADVATKFKLNEFNEQLEAMRRGLATVVPQRMLVLYTWEELELMVCGRPKMDLNLLKEMTVYVGCAESDSHIQSFWKVLTSFSEETRCLYLRFVWGRSRLPTSRAAWGDAPHKISSFDVSSRQTNAVDVDALLPRSHTCYFSLDLPRYSSEEVLRKKLLFAIENCTEIDADQTTTGNRSAALGFELDVDVTDSEEFVSPLANGSNATVGAGMEAGGTPAAGTSRGRVSTASTNSPAPHNVHEHERRSSQSSFGSDLDEDDEDDIFEAESEVLSNLGHDLDAINVFQSSGIIDFGDEDDDDDQNFNA